LGHNSNNKKNLSKDSTEVLANENGENMMMAMIKDEKLSEIFYIMKALAIFTVICAHCNLENANYISGVYKNIGTIGVGVFLFISGFYLKMDADFFKYRNKFFTTLKPWAIASSIIWLEVSIRKGDISFLSWMFHLIGNGSIFYFFVVYFIIWAIAIIVINKIKLNCTIAFVVSFILNIVANIMENSSISFFPTPLLNPFVFLSYFMLGCLFGRNKDKFLLYSNSPLCLLGGGALLVLFLPGFSTYYWNGIIEILIECSIIMFLPCIASMLLKYKKYIIPVGKDTLFIYIWHLIPMTLVNYVGNKYLIMQNCFILWPFVVLLTMACVGNIFRNINICKLNSLLGVNSK